jgi:hypothetical protein
MDPAAIRDESIAVAGRLGHQVSTELPLLDLDVRLRGQDEVVRRCLAQYVAVAVAYGYGRDRAWAWLKREGLSDEVAPSERSFLEGAGDADTTKAGVESLWTLCWALGIVGYLDFSKLCGGNLVRLFPDLKIDDAAGPFMAKARLRSLDEIAAAVDLAYCLHWAITNAGLSGQKLPGRVPPYVVIERRHALEWMLSDEDWDEVPLDT